MGLRCLHLRRSEHRLASLDQREVWGVRGCWIWPRGLAEQALCSFWACTRASALVENTSLCGHESEHMQRHRGIHNFCKGLVADDCAAKSFGSPPGRRSQYGLSSERSMHLNSEHHLRTSSKIKGLLVMLKGVRDYAHMQSMRTSTCT